MRYSKTCSSDLDEFNLYVQEDSENKVFHCVLRPNTRPMILKYPTTFWLPPASVIHRTGITIEHALLGTHYLGFLWRNPS